MARDVVFRSVWSKQTGLEVRDIEIDRAFETESGRRLNEPRVEIERESLLMWHRPDRYLAFEMDALDDRRPVGGIDLGEGDLAPRVSPGHARSPGRTSLAAR
ncbi:MAG TPA: hypothetical protein VK849_09025 [Longimicrobiales bacterium]|nr:hypothetical protein [Longimicrobiales bacterium]